jgi:hypothetical protein
MLMHIEAKKVILNSKGGYSDKYDLLLNELIDKKILLFCTVGKDCELWHDVMDEFYVGNGDERDFLMLTTWHTDQTLEEVIEFAKDFDIEGIYNERIEIIEV